jgi:TonB family protein
VFGFLRPRIVVPVWVRAAAAEEQRLILLHEQEHIRVRDQWQLLLSIVTTAVMPWNPFLWLQARRLGFRVETDCDARVLAIAPDAQRYANLLLSVGAKQNGLLLMPALAEERRGLERRLHMMAKGIVQNRWKAAGLLVLGAVVTVMACESRLPNEPQQPTPALVPTTTESLQRKQDGRTAQEPNVAELAQKYYPPLLRDAGIGGLVGIEATVRTSGAVDNYRIVRSSGHAALDQAGLRVVKEMRLLPRRVPAGQQPKDEVHRIFLDFKKGEVDQTWVHRNPKSQEVSAPDTAVVLPAMLDAQERQDQPHFTPYTKKPEVRNRAEIQVALAREYPPLLRDAGIEGTVLLWLLLNEQGDVVKAQLKTSSGRAELDSAGVSVAKRMKFTPAENRGRRVKVWIALPIVFKTK